MSVVTASDTLCTHSLLPFVLSELVPDLGRVLENSRQCTAALSLIMLTSSPFSASLSTSFLGLWLIFHLRRFTRSSLQTLFHTVSCLAPLPSLLRLKLDWELLRVTSPFLCLPTSSCFSTNCSLALHDTYYHSHVSAHAFIDVIVAKLLFIFLNAFVRYWGCEISDCAVQGLHLHQKSLKLLHPKSSNVRSQFDQCSVISGVGKVTHVDFERKLFEIVRAPNYSSSGVKQAMRRPFSKTDPTTMPAAMMINAKAFKQLWHHLKG